MARRNSKQKPKRRNCKRSSEVCCDGIKVEKLPPILGRPFPTGFAACGGIGRRQRSRAAMPNTFGKLFTITTWGESHGPAVGVVIDGCPPRLPLEAAEIQAELDRRRPGQSDIVTPRKEEDRVEILAGVFEGRTTGAPISLLVRNADQRPGAYDEMRGKFRPSHADFTYQTKFGFRDHRGGGRSS